MGIFGAYTVAPIDHRTKPTNTPYAGKQLYIANSDRQACSGLNMVRDVDGSWVPSNLTLAAKQKAAASRAATKDSEYVVCITDLLTATDAGAEAEALEALLDCAERVDEADTAARPELRVERADAELRVEVTRWAERAAEGDEADDARAVVEAATAVTSAATADAKASERVVRDEMHGAAAETWRVLQSSFIQVRLQRPIVFSQKLRVPPTCLLVAGSAEGDAFRALRGRRSRAGRQKGVADAHVRVAEAGRGDERREDVRRRGRGRCR